MSKRLQLTVKSAPDDLAPTYARIKWHVAPFLIVLYIAAFLDRVNISFASLTMNRDLHISDSLFGLGAGIFFVGYLLFAVPSNVMLVKLGARRWIAILMVVWGVVSASTAFIHGGSIYILFRFLLGAAEAGFFPGIILYLTLWLPSAARASLLALFVISIPLSNVIGAPLSAWILSMGGAMGLKGWQWLFLAEGIPPIVLGLLVPFLLGTGPEAVSWLNGEEKLKVLAALQNDRPSSVSSRDVLSPSVSNPSGSGSSVSAPTVSAPRRWTALLANRTVLGHAAQYLVLMVGLYALSFWVPRILTSRNVSLHLLGWLTAVPFAFGAAGMLICSWHSDKTRERRWHLFGSFLCAAAGIAMAAPVYHWAVALIGLAFAATGIFSAMPIFWTAATADVDAASAPVAIAFINSIGNLGGFAGPLVIGGLLQHTGSYILGLLFTSACLLCGAGVSALQRSESGQADRS